MKEKSTVSKDLFFIFLNQLRDAVLLFFTALPKWVRKNFIWGLLVIPFVFAYGMYGVSEADIFGWYNFRPCKRIMEVIHPSLLALATAISIAGYMKTKTKSFSFLAVLAAFALTRELLGQGTTIIFMTGIVGLIYYGARYRDQLSSLLDSRWIGSFFAMCFVCYILSQLLDRGVIKRIGWLILWDTSWKPPHSSNIEEGLESLGGFFLVMTSVALFFKKQKQ